LLQDGLQESLVLRERHAVLLRLCGPMRYYPVTKVTHLSPQRQQGVVVALLALQARRRSFVPE
jgi:hypothetical protein